MRLLSHSGRSGFLDLSACYLVGCFTLRFFCSAVVRRSKDSCSQRRKKNELESSASTDTCHTLNCSGGRDHMPVFDIVVHVLGMNHTPPAWFPEAQRPPDRRFEITERLWVGKLRDETTRKIIDTCTPKAYGFECSKGPFRQIYVYGKEVPLPFSHSKERWDDDDGKLLPLVALSRLVHPTTAGLRFAARVGLNSEETVEWIWPAHFSGVQLDAFIAPTNSRDWLTIPELEALKEIVGVLDQLGAGKLALHKRIWRAFWYHEYAARSCEVDLRWPLVATGIEALMCIGDKGLGRQFCNRSVALARELGVSEFEEEQARYAWKMRCGLAHGQSLGSIAEKDLTVYTAMESVLRLAVLKAFRDPHFSEAFEDNSAIRQRWPLM